MRSASARARHSITWKIRLKPTINLANRGSALKVQLQASWKVGSKYILSGPDMPQSLYHCRRLPSPFVRELQSKKGLNDAGGTATEV